MFTNLLTQLPFFICLFWFLFFLLQRKNTNQNSRDMLALFMLFSMGIQISIIAYFNNDKSLYLYFDWLFIMSTLLMAPTFYLYVKSITQKDLIKKDLLHFLPAIIITSSYLYFFLSLTHAEKMTFLNDILMSRQKPEIDIENPIHRVLIVFIINRITFALQTIIYLITTIKSINRFSIRVKSVYSDSEGKEVRWASILVITIAGASVFSTVFNIWGRPLFIGNNIMLMLPTFIFTTIHFLIGILGNQQSFTIKDLLKAETEANNIEFEQEKPNCIKRKLEDLIKEQKLFLTKDLRITDLCQELNTNRTYLSQVLNDELNENFNTYINKHRVNHAISLLKEEEWKHYSLEKFSELSGFGSTSSMIRAFKQFTGKTPREYRL